MGATVRKWIMSYYLYVHKTPMIVSVLLSGYINLYFKDTLSPIVRTHLFLLSEHINLKTIKETYLVSPKSTLMETLNITNNGPED